MKSCLALCLVLLHACPLHLSFGVRFEEFFGYPFGTENGDSAFPKDDDAAPANSVRGVAVPASMRFPYFCNSFVYLNVSVCASYAAVASAECVSLVLARRCVCRAAITTYACTVVLLSHLT